MSELRSVDEILADLRQWERSNRLPQAETVSEFGGRLDVPMDQGVDDPDRRAVPLEEGHPFRAPPNATQEQIGDAL
eukprot:13823481-Alexandrium_andersonii.AAC.1